MIAKHGLRREIHTLAILGTVVMLVLAACGGEKTPATSATPMPTSTITAAHATLKHMPYGNAELRWDASSKTLTVEFSLIGLLPNSTHPTQIYAGSSNHGGKMLYPLQDIASDNMGNATATSTVNNVAKGIPTTGWNVSIHNGPGVTAADEAVSISCGDISNTSLAHTVKVDMNTSPGKDQAASGMVLLTLSGEQLTVKLAMSGLEPNSVHPFHIHRGNCLNQGGVAYHIPNVVAGASGNVQMTTRLEHVPLIPSSGWYVNVHYSTDLTSQTGADPLVCGDIIPG